MPSQGHESSVTLETLLAASECAPSGESEHALLLFECDGIASAIHASCVASIEEAGVMVPLPFPPPDVAGVASIRGVMRLVVRLGASTPTGRGRLIALSNDRNLAIYADRVHGVVTVEPEAQDSTASTPDRSASMLVNGREVRLVDTSTLMNP